MQQANGPKAHQPTRLLPIGQVQARTDICKAKLYGLIREGRFPPPVKLDRKSLWPEHEIEAVLAAQIAGASDDQLRALVVTLLENRKRRFSTVLADAA